MKLTLEIQDNDKEKAILLETLSQQSNMVLSQAFLYAQNLCEYGVDVAEKWSTAIQQAYALEKAYIKGRYDESEMVMEYSIRKAYTKCWECIENGNAAEKEVFYFRTLGIGICEECLKKILKQRYGISEIEE